MRTKKTTLLFVIFFFSLSFGWAQAPTEPTLQQKLDEVNGGKTAKEKKNTKKEKSPVLNRADPNLSEHDRAVANLAREIELRKELEKLQAEKRKTYTPAEKQAEDRIAKLEKRQRKAEINMAEARANANVRGCDVQTMDINPQVEQPLGWVKLFHQAYVLTIVNKDTLNVDEIRSPMYQDMLATNLCSTGSMRMVFYLDFSDSDMLQVPLVAVSRPADGGLAIEENFTVYLNRNDYYNNVRGGNWIINLNRQQQTR